MKQDQNYFDLVGSYLDKELEGEQLQQFEQDLEYDQDLQQELQFQKELIEGIKANRLAEIKARLNNIPISAGGFSTGTIGKYIAGAVVVGGIGYGVYFISLPSEEGISNSIPDTSFPEIVPEPETKTESLDIANDPDVGIERDGLDQLTQSPEENSNNSTARANETGDSQEAIVPDVPDPLENFDTESASEEELNLPSSELGIEEAPAKSNLEVEIVNNKRKFDFHYQVVDDKLVLYGNFDEEPYELLEINVDTHRKLYLYFKNNYYLIERDALEIRELDRINNEALIQRLGKIKDNNL